VLSYLLYYIIIIIIIIWHYNPLWVFVFSAKSLQVLLSLAASFQFFTFSFIFRSSMTSSCHRCLGLPTGLVPIGFQSSSFLVGLAWSILWICPIYLILCALINLTISAPSIKLSISMLFRILHTLSILTGPNIFLNPLKPELNPICYLLALLAHHFLHVSRIRVKSLTFRRLMSYGAPILDVSRSHTTTQHSR